MKTQKRDSQHTAVTPVVMIRHAQSQWNLENRFTGWADPPLTMAGVAEARLAGAALRASGLGFDVAYSSCLQRAIHTLDILLQNLGQTDRRRFQDWRLNERHYGALQGIDKHEATATAGEQQVWRWRRSYLEKATPLLRHDPSHPVHDPKYADVDPRLLPGVENLAQTRARVAAFWHEHIEPRIRNSERVLISAHGNTLRALLMELSGMSIAEVEGFEIPTATPIIYNFTQDAKPLGWQYLNNSMGLAKSA